METVRPPKVSIDPRFQGVLIGGGVMYESGAPLLERGIEITGVERPNVLWLPSAAGNESFYGRYSKKMREFYEELGTEFDILHPYHLNNPVKSRENDVVPATLPTAAEAEDKIGSADVLLITGGNPLMMDKYWDLRLPQNAAEFQAGHPPLDELAAGADDISIKKLLHARVVEPDVSVTGQSAGLNHWSEHFHSDWQSYVVDKDGEWEYHVEQGAAFMTGTVVVPHYNKLVKMWEGHKVWREHSFDDFMHKRQDRRELGIAVDDNAALEFVGDSVVRVITGGEVAAKEDEEWRNRRQVWTIDHRAGEVRKQVVEPTEEPFPFTDLAA